jgi:hypothetical protein
MFSTVNSIRPSKGGLEKGAVKRGCVRRAPATLGVGNRHPNPALSPANHHVSIVPLPTNKHLL